MGASMLVLPREIYLQCCAYLTPKDIAMLARVCKDHYLAAQVPLFERIRISSWPHLVILVRTLTKTPVVSYLSPKQRLNWQRLTDAQLREREIRHFELVLDARKGTEKVTGANLSNMIGAISRGNRGVKINLMLHGSWLTLLSQLQNVALPDVRKLKALLGGIDLNSYSNQIAKSFSLWDLCFGGAAFPDLQEIELDTLNSAPEALPDTLSEAARVESVNENGWRRYDSSVETYLPFYGLKKMNNIKLKFNDELKASTLKSLFGSNIIPQHLTRVEIVNCPSLNQIKDLEALSMLLQRGLQLLQHLKLHLQRLHHNRDYDELKYGNEINDNPDWHLCNVVRELGQRIKSLDLALPFACNRIFLPVPKTSRDRVEPKDYPTIPREPVHTLPQRLLDEGYRYRRLLVWNGVCKDRHDWDEMPHLADEQGNMISWEIVSRDDKCASWHVSGCLPHKYSSRDVLKRQLEETER